MKVDINITLTGDVSEGLQRLRGGLAERSQLHARIAGSVEKMVRKYGRGTTGDQHATAYRLGATPTRHLEKAYRDISSKSDETAAVLLIPRASRLRAAFGDYIVKPGSGKTYLTIPACAEAYGKRAKEFADLVFVRLGPRMTPTLSRKLKTGEGLQVMYWLTKQTKIKEDRNLLPFDDIGPDARDTTRKYLQGIMRKGGVA